MSAQQEVFSLIAKLGGSQYKTVVDRTLCEYMGGLEGGIFLAQLLYWADKGNGDWFYKPYPEWKDETYLSEYQVRKIAKQCEAMGFLETKLRKVGGAPTMHYRVDVAKFTVSILEFLRMETEKFQNGNLKNEESIESEKLKEPYIDTNTTTKTTANTTGESASAPPANDPSGDAPVELHSRNAINETSSKRFFKSPHIDKAHFDPATGFVRPGTGATAVEVFYERFDICADAQRLTVPMEDDLVRHCPDLNKLRDVITAYSRGGFRNQRNIQLILDWYRGGIPDGPASSRASPNGRLAPVEKGRAAAASLRERIIASGKENILG